MSGCISQSLDGTMSVLLTLHHHHCRGACVSFGIICFLGTNHLGPCLASQVGRGWAPSVYLTSIIFSLSNSIALLFEMLFLYLFYR